LGGWQEDKVGGVNCSFKSNYEARLSFPVLQFEVVHSWWSE
jgi:hypothetical protein